MTPPKLYGLIGSSVKHSLSPAMHNAAFSHLKINAEYKLFPLKAEELNNFLKNLSKNNICGLNVTVPYKEKVIPFLHSISDEAKLIGAVNTIRVLRDKLEGFNTDGEGFLKHLTRDLRFTPKDKIIATIGAGGASRAVCVYLARERARTIAIYDIDKAKTIALVKHLKENFPGTDFKIANSIAELDIRNCDLLINATPVGMKASEPCLIDEKLMHKNLLVYDLIYNPTETKLLKIAREKGCRTACGLGMLLYQGAFSFELWTGKKAPLEVMRKALKEALEK